LSAAAATIWFIVGVCLALILDVRECCT